jgi:hypothetical protein
VRQRTAIRSETDKDWQFEQVRSEIKRLRELLRNPSLTAEERAIAQSQLDNYLTKSNPK